MRTNNIIYVVIFIIIGMSISFSCKKKEVCINQIWYLDADGDGFGTPYDLIESCTQPAGYVLNNFDFDDNDASLNPRATEIADNHIDENGDGKYAYNLYIDNDIDSYGASGTLILVNVPNVVCSDSDVPSGYSLNDDDCDDYDATTYPNALEILGDGIDNNCNGNIDECLPNNQITIECNCADGIDNDGDGDVDFADSDC